MISQKALTEFQATWRGEFGEEISDDYALELAVALLGLFDEVYKPIRKEWDEQV